MTHQYALFQLSTRNSKLWEAKKKQFLADIIFIYNSAPNYKRKLTTYDNTQWMNEQMNEWKNEQMKEWTNERMNKWMNERMNERSKDWNDTEPLWLLAPPPTIPPSYTFHLPTKHFLSNLSFLSSTFSIFSIFSAKFVQTVIWISVI